MALFLATALSLYFAAPLTLGPGTGLRFAVALLSILLAHEMGHYVAARLYRVDATLPFFIPSPWLPTTVGWIPLGIGTFGAVIRIRSPFPNRKALFDIGIAGPLAGFVVAIPILALGVLEAHFSIPRPDGGPSFGEPIVFHWAVVLLRADYDPTMTLMIGPLGMAAWFGLLVTALNLMPIGQLDGGHVAYALLRGRALLVSRFALFAALVLVSLWPMWLLWTILVFLLGRRPHPATLADHRPIGRGRVVVGLLGVAVFAVCFTPSPVILSWPQFIEHLRDAALFLVRRFGLS